MAEQGSIAITQRGDGNRWYGRVSIPVSIAALANVTAGTRITAKCANGFIIIYQDENGRIKFPGTTGKLNPRHAFEAATTTLGLREMVVPQSPAHTFIEDGRIKIRVPEECMATELKQRKRARKENSKSPPPAPRAPITPVTGIYGAAAAIVTEANRAGKKVRPMSQSDIVQLLVGLGKEVVARGPRFFTYQGSSANISDLLEAANKLTSASGEGTIVLVMD
jgi:hypothetical protein